MPAFNIPPTGQHLLAKKYGISMESVSRGCLISYDQILHDSLMLMAIRRQYGPDFFERFEREASQLDQ